MFNQAVEAHSVTPLTPRHALAKRVFDIFVSGVGLVVLSPIFVATAVAIRVTSPGPVIFRQTRVGRNGERIGVRKFRTMIDGAEALGRETAGTHDPRITPLGRRLRRTKLDELPQLVNVFVGDMSMVGPRPEIPFYADQYGPDDRVVLSVNPGITDPASLEMADLDAFMQSRGDEPPADFYVREVQPRKLALQKEYLANQSLWGDVVIIWRTLVRIVGA